MSQPTFPELSPEITREDALNMILISIAKEETALSNIMNAESEKLRYIIEKLDVCAPCNQSYANILEVNQSVTRLLESVSQNQMLLKNKMESVLQAMPEREKCCICCRESSCDCECGCECTPDDAHDKCRAVFRNAQNFEIWRENCSLPWTCESAYGQCIVTGNMRDNAKITLMPGSYTLAFAVNARRRSPTGRTIMIKLRKLAATRRSDVFTYFHPLSDTNELVTLASGGIIIENYSECEAFSIFLELCCPESLSIESAMLSIVRL